MLKNGRKLKKKPKCCFLSQFFFDSRKSSKNSRKYLPLSSKDGSVQKNGLPGPLFCHFLPNKQGDKNTSFLMKYQLLKRGMIFIAIFNFFVADRHLYFVSKVAEVLLFLRLERGTTMVG